MNPQVKTQMHTQMKTLTIKKQNDGNQSTPQAEKPIGLKPESLPDKFWDEASQTIRVDDMAKSYRLLEQQHGRLQAATQKTDHLNQELTKQQNEKSQLEEEKNTMMATLQEATIFGGDWQNKKTATIAWAENMLGKETATEVMARPDGLRALQRMQQEVSMSLSEPNLLASNSDNDQRNSMDENTLRRLMKTPGYWRDKNPALLQKVQKGFDRIYGDKK